MPNAVLYNNTASALQMTLLYRLYKSFQTLELCFSPFKISKSFRIQIVATAYCTYYMPVTDMHTVFHLTVTKTLYQR